MLNQFFNGSIGFQNGVRASACLCGFLFLLSLSLMRQRITPVKSDSNMLRMMQTFVTDMPFVLMTFGWVLVEFLSVVHWICRSGLLLFMLSSISLFSSSSSMPSRTVLLHSWPSIWFVGHWPIVSTLHVITFSIKIAILNGSSVLGRIVPTLFVPRIGVFNVTIACIWIAVILVFCTLVVKNVAGTIIYAIMYGFFSGSCMSPVSHALEDWYLDWYLSRLQPDHNVGRFDCWWSLRNWGANRCLLYRRWWAYLKPFHTRNDLKYLCSLWRSTWCALTLWHDHECS